MNGTGKREIEEREQAATRAADDHYMYLHNARHDSRIPYKKCVACLKEGWR